MDNEAANIGFAASIDTGVSVAGTPVKANFQCEQFTFFNRIANFNHSNWCSRNSKLGLSGPWGEVMFSGWLTPYNEVTAQWIDPFYDAGSHTHSTLLGNVGWGPSYGNTGFDHGGYGGGVSGQGFMRRKDNLFQWFSPNWGGLQMRVGWSNNSRFSSDESEVTTGLKTGNMVPMYEDTDIGKTLRRDGSDARYVTQADVTNVMTAEYATAKLDPQILSVGIAYTTTINETDELWVALGYQQHDEFAAVENKCADSDDQTVRYAARYIHDWGNGHSTRLSWAYEEMEYDWEYCGGTPGAGPFNFGKTEHGMVDLEREAWLVSGKHDFPGPMDFRFMYMEADDFDCGASMENTTDGLNCAGITEKSSGAEAFSVGLYYTLPAGTELRMVYGEVDNDANSRNGFGISGGTTDFATVASGKKEESFQFGVVQWF